MSRLSKGEREFVTDFDLSLTPQQPAPSASAPLERPPVRAGMAEIDARGINAPLPLLRAYRALRGMEAGQELRVITSYPQSVAEFEAMVKYVTSYELVSQNVVGEDYVHVLRKRR